MHEKVKQFIEDQKIGERRYYENERDKALLDLGLYEKEYSPDNKYDEDYYYSEWDSDNSENRFYKKVPIKVSDEEYEEIKKYTKKVNTSDDNPIATALTIIAWVVFIGGFIAGICLGNVEVEGYYRDYTEFSFAIAFTYWCVSLVSGTMFLGFAEIIKLLDAIKKK